MRREEVLVVLLERFDELTDPVRSGNGGGDTGLRLLPHDPGCKLTSSSPPRCSCSHRSIVELERLLAVMRLERPKQWRHVRARYITRTQAVKDVRVKRKAKNGKTVTVVERRLVDQYPKWVHRHVVELGVRWLAKSWDEVRAGGEPMLPAELMQVAA